MSHQQLSVREEPDHVRFGGFLERAQGTATHAQLRVQVRRDHADEALENRAAKDQAGRVLVPADLAERNRPRADLAELIRIAAARVHRDLTRDLFAGGLRACGFVRRLLDTRHEYFHRRTQLEPNPRN